MCDIEERDIRSLCTEAVFERGRNYRQEGRVHHLARFGDEITAQVQGSRRYDVHVDLSASDVSPHCTCPYEAPGACKHVIAVLLDVAADPPADESGRIEAILDRIDAEELHVFVREACANDPDLRERFFARFGDIADVSADEFRNRVEQRFEQHTDEYPVVVEAIDFSDLFEIAENYRDREQHRAAAKVYRGLIEGLGENANLVDAAYDHYARTFQSALDGYVDCIVAADPDEDEIDARVQFLEEQLQEGTAVYREQIEAALEELESRC
jgi:uncharacterized Zn finger protein